MNFNPVITINPSPTVTINGLALKKAAAGERVYNLSAGEPILPPSEILIEAANRAMRGGKTLYPPVAGIPELRQAMAGWVNQNYGTQFLSEQILVTAGGKFGIYALCQAFIKPGDEVIIIAPYWTSYPDIVVMSGGRPVIVAAEETSGWKVSPESVRAAITDKTKCLILNNGSNPTGILYSRKDLKRILEIAKERNTIVVSDEVYSGLVYDGAEYVSCAGFPEHAGHVIVIQSCSKHFAMTGWRVGFVLGPERVIKILTMLQSQSTSGAATVNQWVALAAVQNADGIVTEVRSALQRRRNVLVTVLEEAFKIKINAPAAALYMFIALASLNVTQTDSVEFCEQILDKANIATVPGTAFGRDGYVRLSFGAPEQELREAMKAMVQYMQQA